MTSQPTPLQMNSQPSPSQEAPNVDKVYMPLCPSQDSALSKLLSSEEPPPSQPLPKSICSEYIATRADKIQEMLAKKKQKEEECLRKLQAKQEHERKKREKAEQKKRKGPARKKKTAAAALLGLCVLPVYDHCMRLHSFTESLADQSEVTDMEEFNWDELAGNSQASVMIIFVIFLC